MGTSENHFRGTKDYALVYTELITAAKYRGTVTYQEIAKMMGLPLQGNHMSKVIGQILGEIAEDEVTNGRPMLSVIAVNIHGKLGTGFLPLAKQLGRLKDENEEAFWQAERKAVYETWKVVLKEAPAKKEIPA